jgi:hypothetical protein
VSLLLKYRLGHRLIIISLRSLVKQVSKNVKQKAYFMPLAWEPIFVLDFPLLRIYRERRELIINLWARVSEHLETTEIIEAK